MSPKFLNKKFFEKNGGEPCGQARPGSVQGENLYFELFRTYSGRQLGYQWSLSAKFSSAFFGMGLGSNW